MLSKERESQRGRGGFWHAATSSLFQPHTGYSAPCSLPELACVWLCGCLAAFSIFRRVFSWNDVHLPHICVALIAIRVHVATQTCVRTARLRTQLTVFFSPQLRWNTNISQNLLSSFNCFFFVCLTVLIDYSSCGVSNCSYPVNRVLSLFLFLIVLVSNPIDCLPCWLP